MNERVLRAPYNFVPLNGKAPFIPNLPGEVSQDRPFSNGVSGCIDLRIKAVTDIFVRNGYPKPDKEDKSCLDTSFCNINGRYFIPGSSLKGMLRNVLEIAGFGKLSRVNKDRFAFRDLNDKRYRELVASPYAGWMFYWKGQYYIDECRELRYGKDVKNPDSISVRDMDASFGTHFGEFIEGRGNFKEDKNRMAGKKYEMLSQLANARKLKDITIEDGYLCRITGGIHKGRYLVCTGQPGVREWKYVKYRGKFQWTGKGKEFLFPKGPNTNNLSMPVSQDDFEAFELIHQASDDYKKFWKDKLKKGLPVPVFYKKVQDDSGVRHTYIGLSYMFKYPAKTGVWDAIPEGHKTNSRHDLAELVFGYADAQDSLKGRVQVGNAFAEGNPVPQREQEYALSSPKPSYYPLYLKYDKKPVSWDDKAAQVAGFKRYPVRSKAILPRLKDEVSEAQRARMKPLPAGTTFTGRITFHNLRPEELGALLYAITMTTKKADWGRYHHQVGGSKPYGYGNVIVTPELRLSHDMDKTADIAEYIGQYDNLLKNNFSMNWEESATIRELQAMAKGIPDAQVREFTYMEMSMKGNNEFLQGKKQYIKEGERLGLFTEIVGGRVPQGSVQQSNQNNQNNQNKRNNQNNRNNRNNWNRRY